jgi:hypothetical protein
MVISTEVEEMQCLMRRNSGKDGIFVLEILG